MKSGQVPSSWLSIAGFSAENNLALLEEVTRRKVSPKDLDAVRKVWQEIQRRPKK